MKNYKTIFLLLALGGLFTACEETDLNGLGEAEQRLTDYYYQAEQSSSHLYNMADRVMRDDQLAQNDSSSFENAVVLRTGTNEVTVDFGEGTYGNDGRIRSGQVIITETGDYFQEGGSLGLALVDFSEASQTLAGSMNIAHNGSDSVALNVSDLLINSEFTFNSQKQAVWLSGFDTKSDMSDDAYKMHGVASGSLGSSSISSQVENGSEMHYARSCQYGMLAGVLALNYSLDSSSTTGTFDFIDSDGCENLLQITVEQDGNSITFFKQFTGF